MLDLRKQEAGAVTIIPDLISLPCSEPLCLLFLDCHFVSEFPYLWDCNHELN